MFNRCLASGFLVGHLWPSGNREDVMAPAPDRLTDFVVGIVGFGAFGQLMADHLTKYFRILVYDVAADANRAAELGVEVVPLERIADCSVVVLSVPVNSMRGVFIQITPYLRPGAVVVDVGSVKLEPAAAMEEHLPDHIEVVATHPLFGPRSVGDGLRGLKIAVCPIRGARFRVAAFCRMLGLKVVMTTPEEHDRDLANVQGLTHLVANVLANMDLRPTRMTTRSFDLMIAAVEAVRHDAPEIIHAILRTNPYAGDMIARFKAATLAFEDRSSPGG